VPKDSRKGDSVKTGVDQRLRQDKTGVDQPVARSGGRPEDKAGRPAFSLPIRVARAIALLDSRGRSIEAMSATQATLDSSRSTSSCEVALRLPQEVTRAFADALSAADLDRAASFFADDGCLVTPDATAVHGPQGIRASGHQGIRAILAQLTAGRVQLRVASKSVHTITSMALCIFTYAREGAAPFIQVSDSTVLLRRQNRAWKLLIVAPWGIADADRHPFAAMPWPRQRSPVTLRVAQ
jgi:ketosteroid isomerase-like protein